MENIELLKKAHALQADILAVDNIFPWAVTAAFAVDTIGATVLTVKLHGYGDDHRWHLKKEISFSNYPNEKQTWDEFLDKVNRMIMTKEY